MLIHCWAFKARGEQSRMAVLRLGPSFHNWAPGRSFLRWGVERSDGTAQRQGLGRRDALLGFLPCGNHSTAHPLGCFLCIFPPNNISSIQGVRVARQGLMVYWLMLLTLEISECLSFPSKKLVLEQEEIW
uniref:Uncharacterized protein n=1 Tax=Rousettus aegyptiacus TaxID=9407 RepID=A0A7J8KAW6_ROUAE|nr:hypothetical protein HJG63_007880 [Rousettus aegyptiacus]